MTTTSGHVYGRGEGERREARGSVMFFKTVAATTAGRLSVMERTLPPGGRMPPAHTHEGDEAYFVLEGTVTFSIGGDDFKAGAEAFVHVPGGVTHTFGNTSADSARLLVLHAPALDGYFRDLEALWACPKPPTKEQERSLMRRHGLHPVDEHSR